MVYERKKQGVSGWWFHYQDPETGKQRQRRCKSPGKREANLEAAQFKIELKKRFRPKASDDLRDFLERSFWPAQEVHLTRKAALRQKGIIDLHLGPFFNGSMRLITRDRIIEYMAKRLASKASRETVRKEIKVLKHALRVAVKFKYLEKNPFDDLERGDLPMPGEKRTRHLMGDEWQRLIQKIPISKRPAIILLVNTGMRRGELMNLEWSDVDLLGGFANIPKTKGGMGSGRGRTVQLTPEMVTLLSNLPKHQDNPKIFWQFTGESLSASFRRAVKLSGLKDLHLHDLRHTFATETRKSGIGIDIIAKLLGHSDSRQSERYAHVSDEMLEKAAGSIRGKFH